MGKQQGFLGSVIPRLPGHLKHARLPPHGEILPWRVCPVPPGKVSPPAPGGADSPHGRWVAPRPVGGARVYVCACVCIYACASESSGADCLLVSPLRHPPFSPPPTSSSLPCCFCLFFFFLDFRLILWSFCPSLRQPHVTLPAAPQLGLEQEPGLLYYQLEGGGDGA